MSVDRLICGCIGHKGVFVVSLQLSGIRSGLLLHVFRGLCVCFFCWTQPWAIQKRQNRSMYRFVCGHIEVQGNKNWVGGRMWHFWGSYLSYTELFSDNIVLAISLQVYLMSPRIPTNRPTSKYLAYSCYQITTSRLLITSEYLEAISSSPIWIQQQRRFITTNYTVILYVVDLTVIVVLLIV